MKILYCNHYDKKTDLMLRGRKTAVALGNFDGVHIGHAELIKGIVSKKGFVPCVYMFEHHPSIYLSGVEAKLLTKNEQKTDILFGMGVKAVCFDDFEKVRDLSPRDFVKRVLIDELSCGLAVCGPNYRFGKNGCGNAEFLKSELEKNGMRCDIISPVVYDDELVSSTRIRRLVEDDGDVEMAAKLLGRPFYYTKEVIYGNMIGRTLGMPTLNQSIDVTDVCPKHGVYVSQTIIDGKTYPSVTDVGTKPTVGGTQLLAETHVFDTDEDLYGKTVTVRFLSYVRPENKFSTLDELKKAINDDVIFAKKYFGSI